MKKVLIAFIALFTVVLAENAYAQKLGHINSAELIEVMPERAKITSDLEAYAKQLETQMNTMMTEYQSKTTEYQTNEQVWTDIVKRAKLQDITGLEKRIQEFQQTAQQSLADREKELATPLLDKAQKAIKDVANANGYTYVFDTSSGTILHYPDGDDILPLVKKHLGIQ